MFLTVEKIESISHADVSYKRTYGLNYAILNISNSPYNSSTVIIIKIQIRYLTYVSYNSLSIYVILPYIIKSIPLLQIYYYHVQYTYN